MNKSILAWLGAATMAVAAAAQTTVTTTGGTTNTVPVFTGGATVGNSPITVSGGSVGIGTTSPAYELEVNGNLGIDGAGSTANYLSSSGSSVLCFTSGGSCAPGAGTPSIVEDWGINLIGSASQMVRVPNAALLVGYGNYGISYPAGDLLVSGSVGIGTPNPNSTLHVDAPAIGTTFPIYVTNNSTANASKSTGIAFGGYDTVGGEKFAGSITSIESNSNISGGGLALSYSNGNIYSPSSLTTGMVLNSAGDVGIGTTNPSAKLEVDGNLKLTANSGASITFADGTSQSTAYTGVVCGGDYAESVDVTGSRTNYEPGDVLVIDPSAPGKFLKSNQPYSTLVTGIYSTKPGTVGRRQTTSKSPDEVPMAMIGIVPTKVTAENGPIKTGDLLVASSTAGRAMKGTDRSQLTGAVIGKALGNLDSGTGVIEVVVTLQ
jgi:hypothetical protein